MQKLTQSGFTNLNVNHKAVKPLEESIGKSLLDLEFGKDFLDTAPKA